MPLEAGLRRTRSRTAARCGDGVVAVGRALCCVLIRRGRRRTAATEPLWRQSTPVSLTRSLCARSGAKPHYVMPSAPSRAAHERRKNPNLQGRPSGTHGTAERQPVLGTAERATSPSRSMPGWLCWTQGLEEKGACTPGNECPAVTGRRTKRGGGRQTSRKAKPGCVWEPPPCRHLQLRGLHRDFIFMPRTQQRSAPSVLSHHNRNASHRSVQHRPTARGHQLAAISSRSTACGQPLASLRSEGHRCFRIERDLFCTRRPVSPAPLPRTPDGCFLSIPGRASRGF